MKDKPRSYRRSVRKQQVLKQLRIWNDNGYATEATTYKLARALDLRPAHTFRQILNEMVAEGDLVRELRSQPGRTDTYFYALSPSRTHYHEKYGKRRIVIKHKGVISGQMELAL